VLPLGEDSEKCSESAAVAMPALRLDTSRLPIYSTRNDRKTPAIAIAVVVPS